jgi:hypothetical protein
MGPATPVEVEIVKRCTEVGTVRGTTIVPYHFWPIAAEGSIEPFERPQRTQRRLRSEVGRIVLEVPPKKVVAKKIL